MYMALSTFINIEKKDTRISIVILIDREVKPYKTCETYNNVPYKAQM